MQTKFVNSTRMFVSAKNRAGIVRVSTVSTRFSFVRFLLCRQRQRMGGNRQKIADVHSRGTCDLLVFYLLDKTLVEHRAREQRASVNWSSATTYEVLCVRTLVRPCVARSCIRTFVRPAVYVFLPSCPVRSSRGPRLPFPIPRP